MPTRIGWDQWTVGRFTWSLQELLKGDMVDFVPFTDLDVNGGSTYGGWGFNFHYRVEGDIGKNTRWAKVGGVGDIIRMKQKDLVLEFPLSPGVAANIRDQDLRRHPFFRPGDAGESAGLYDPEQGAPGLTAINSYVIENYDRLLAEMFPARTFAVGISSVSTFEPEEQPTRNFNLNSQAFQSNGWPRGDGQWMHSDIKDVSYVHAHKLFESQVVLGGLKQ
jgi:hypothetical protein